MKKFTILALTLFLSIATTYSQSITVSFPNGGEHWINNTWSPQNIVWESDGVTNFLIEYSDDSGSSWNTIDASYSGEYNYSWTTPDIISENCLIKISDADNTATNDQSDVEFLISDESIYYAEWNTTKGIMRVQLRGDLVPTTVQNFINLSEKGFDQDLIFHRVISNFMIQDGCPLGTGYGDPGYDFDDEFHPELRHSHAGILSMANAGPNTNGSQYFITLKETNFLDDAHAVFGRIVDGMDVLYEIGEVETDGNDKPLEDIILSIDIVEENMHLEITYPADGASIINNNTINNIIDIEWESDFVLDVKVEFSENNGADWQTLTDSIPADASSLEWELPTTYPTECLIKITSLKNPTLFAVHTIPFEIRQKLVELSRFDFYENVEADVSNPNNLVMPGEVVKFRVKKKNDYAETLTETSAILSCDNLTINQNTATFNSVASGEEIWSNEVFEIVIPEDIPTLAEYILTISVADNNVDDDDWRSFITLPILDKGIFSNFYDGNFGNSQGNDNDILEEGEIIEMNFNIANKSSVLCYNPEGELTSLRSFINIWDGVEGTSGTVYNTTIYNSGNPLPSGSSLITPDNNFVFEYNSNGFYQTTMILELNAYLIEEAGATWDEGGILVKWGIPWVLNEDGSTEITEENNSEISIYPNPAKDYFTINYNNNLNKEISIFSIDGRLLLSETTSSNIHKIDCSNFKSGIYIVKINSDNEQVIRKVILN